MGFWQGSICQLGGTTETQENERRKEREC